MTISESDNPFSPGDVIAEKYVIERVLGVGGMGVVVAAMHLELRERAALKFLLPAAAANPAVTVRFLQEARSAAKIKSEHVARVLDVGKLPSGVPFLVMEYLDGHDLQDVVEARKRLPVAEAVGYVLEACEAIAEAHSLGIVHRDLKPANLFLAKRPSGPPIVKVLDFGISKVTSGEVDRMTKTSAILGSPHYMSPEQMSSARSVDARSDVWALGVVLYELLTGDVPFRGDTMPQVVGAVLHEPPRPIEPDDAIPDPLVAVIHRSLAKDPADRFPDIHALALALAPFSPAAAAISVPRIAHVLNQSGQSSGATLVAATDRVPTVNALSRETVAGLPPRRGAWVSAGLGGVAVATLAAVALHTGSTSAPRPAPVGLGASPTAATSPTPSAAPPDPSSLGAAPPATGAPQPSESAAPTPSVHPVPVAGPRESHPAPAQKRVDCDPPFIIDAKTGHKEYKRECL